MSDLLAQARTYHKAGRLVEAAAAYLAYAQDNPYDPEAGLAIAQWYLANGKMTEAMALVDALLPVLPKEATLYALKGAILLRLKEQDRAEAWLVRAVEVAERSPSKHALAQSWGYLAQAASRRGRWDQCVQLLKRALSVDANEITSRYNLGLCYLRKGLWRRGWSYYEDRWLTIGHQQQHQRVTPGRRWNGEKLPVGTTIMVQAEQGQGDTFQFLRYLPRLAQLGARIFFEYGRMEMKPLLERHMDSLGIEMLCNVGDLTPETEWHVPLLSLPWCLKAYEPVWDGPYLTPSVSVPRETGNLRVGMVWAGSEGYLHDNHRSTTKEQWAEVLGVQGVEWVDLQVGRDGTFKPRSWDETANVLCTLDLLISADTGIVHLAGALGVETWVLIYFQNDWRWGEAGETTPWYPKTRLYRQPTDGDWASVMSAVSLDLTKRVSAHLTTPVEDISV